MKKKILALVFLFSISGYGAPWDVAPTDSEIIEIISETTNRYSGQEGFIEFSERFFGGDKELCMKRVSNALPAVYLNSLGWFETRPSDRKIDWGKNYQVDIDLRDPSVREKLLEAPVVSYEKNSFEYLAMGEILERGGSEIDTDFWLKDPKAMDEAVKEYIYLYREGDQVSKDERIKIKNTARFMLYAQSMRSRPEWKNFELELFANSKRKPGRIKAKLKRFANNFIAKRKAKNKGLVKKKSGGVDIDAAVKKGRRR